MYYVIQRHHNNHKKHFFAYLAAKCIAAKNTQNVIFEISQGGVVKRKWAPKEDLVLLTEDKELFRTTYERLEALSAHHLEKINTVQEELSNAINDFHESMQKEFDLIKSSFTL
ncbi:MAG: hypothetical protein QG558_79 [Campylobacterota bacterium]|nr:hypothetical protein [Campylobacterota bacterium]